MDLKKEIKMGPEARKMLMKGIDTLANAVISTLGPNGRNVVIENGGASPISTKDGVTVAKNIFLEEEIENLGVQMVRQAAMKTSDKAGDGTTTSTLLAQEIIRGGIAHLDMGINAVEVKRGIDEALDIISNSLKSKISKDISNEEQIIQIATISSNNDTEVGNLVATALNKAGKDGVVHIEESKSGETYLEVVEGMQFERGYKSHFFVTNNNNMTCTLEDAHVLIIDTKITQVKDLLPILEEMSQSNKSLLIIAEDLDGEALATLIVNKVRGILKVAAVKAPDFGERRKLIMEDIAILTGGVVVDKNKGMRLEKFNRDWLGSARVITITKDKTTIVDGRGEEENINQRMDELEKQIEKSTTPFEIEQLQNRLAKMAGGVSIIHVGGYTETEMREKKDRVDDALNATKAALEEGIVPGGGSALLFAQEDIDLNQEIIGSGRFVGKLLVKKACREPMSRILKNAGVEDQMIYEIINSVLAKGKESKSFWYGYNLEKEEIARMDEIGIIDPTKVTRTAIENASAVAGTVLLTECVIVNIPSKEPKPDEIY